MKKDFKSESVARLKSVAQNAELLDTAHNFLVQSTANGYSYNFHWVGRPIIQYPQDIMATQELIYEIKPDLIIETGIAHGGSLCLSASILALLEHEEAIKNGTQLDPTQPKRFVLGVDIEIRQHNREAIEKHFLSNRIKMIEGSSIDQDIIEKVKDFSKDFKKILVLLDSNHTHTHVLEELRAYAPLVSDGSYCVVFDTLIENMPEDMYPNRSWGPGNNPMTAVHQYLSENHDFKVDTEIDCKLLVSVANNGYLKRTIK